MLALVLIVMILFMFSFLVLGMACTMVSTTIIRTTMSTASPGSPIIFLHYVLTMRMRMTLIIFILV